MKTKTRKKKRKTRKIQNNYLKNIYFRDIARSLHKLGAFLKQVLTNFPCEVILSTIRRPQPLDRLGVNSKLEVKRIFVRRLYPE